jgi:nucleotide-binding universal stress UspA family protein
MRRFKNILYYADGAATQSASLNRAVALAQSNSAALTAMDVIAESDLASEVEQRFGLKL